jgi:MFS family permease
MNTSLKWALIFGICAAFVNFIFGVVIILCGVLVSPFASGLATYISLKEFPTPNASRFGTQIGLVVGGISSIGICLASFVAGFFGSLPFLMLMVTTLQDESSLSDKLMLLISPVAGIFIVVLIALLVSLFSIGLSCTAGAVTGKVIGNQNTFSTSPANLK